MPGCVVRVEGLEPSIPYGRKILNLECIPFHHTRNTILEHTKRNLYRLRPHLAALDNSQVVISILFGIKGI